MGKKRKVILEYKKFGKIVTKKWQKKFASLIEQIKKLETVLGPQKAEDLEEVTFPVVEQSSKITTSESTAKPKARKPRTKKTPARKTTTKKTATTTRKRRTTTTKE